MADAAQRPERETTDVWVFNEHPGYRRAIERAGSVAAPPLAGFSSPMPLLLLPTLGDETTTIRAGTNASVVKESKAFSGSPELAAILLLVAGLALVFSVQAAITTRYYAHSPATLEEWYPEFFPESSDGTQPPPGQRPSGWVSRAGWSPRYAAGKWYGGWPRQFLYEDLAIGNKWAAWTRRLYHLGIVSLLGGLTVLVIPPTGGRTTGHTLLIILASIGAIAELAWISWNALQGHVGSADSAESCGARPRAQNAAFRYSRRLVGA